MGELDPSFNHLARSGSMDKGCSLQLAVKPDYSIAFMLMIVLS